uniref:Uncharacterized protein n=1 Tax=Setaria italica TaxID=4555 RepID=K4AGS5_SETIT
MPWPPRARRPFLPLAGRSRREDLVEGWRRGERGDIDVVEVDLEWHGDTPDPPRCRLRPRRGLLVRGGQSRHRRADLGWHISWKGGDRLDWALHWDHGPRISGESMSPVGPRASGSRVE